MFVTKLATIITGSALAIGVAGPALAHDCFVARKQLTAGAVVLVNEEGETLLKKNPGTEENPHGNFVAISFGEFEASIMLHAPEGVLPPAREGGSQYNCDGKGIDAASACGLE